MNWFFALFALFTFIAFFCILIWFVPHPDLVVAVLIGLALASYDIVTTLAAGRSR